MKYKSSNILFDKQIFNLQNYGGISRYFSEIIYGVSNSKGFHSKPNVFFSNNVHLKSKQKSNASFIYNLSKFKGKQRIISALNQRENRSIIKLLKNGKYDVFHPTYYLTEFLNYIPNDKPFVLTVHDMIHELYPDPNFIDYHNEVFNKSILIPKASHIIAVSEHTKNDILKLYPDINVDKISVIHHGFSFSDNKRALKNQLKKSYILFVGSRQYYKNFNWLISNISTFLKEQNIDLVCAGGGGFNIDELELIQSAKLETNVSHISIKNDQHLNSLYQHAFCFIYPSLYEGFGIPILEAFANSCPVILANSSCFPEIAGDAALYFDDKISLLNQLTALINSTLLKKNMINSGNDQLKKFTWSESVEKHLDVYRKIGAI